MLVFLLIVVVVTVVFQSTVILTFPRQVEQSWGWAGKEGDAGRVILLQSSFKTLVKLRLLMISCTLLQLNCDEWSKPSILRLL